MGDSVSWKRPRLCRRPVATATRTRRPSLTVRNSAPSLEEGKVSRTRAGGSGTRPRGVKNRASDQRLRRRRSPSRAPPFPSCAGAQSRATNLRSGRAHRSPRWLLLSRATFLGHPRDRPFFSFTLPAPRARSPEPGPGPFPVSLPLTHLVFVLPPFSVPQAGRSRRTDGKSRSCLG